MIDWQLTADEFGYVGPHDLIGIKRPHVVCKCDKCQKIKTIAVRVKARISNGQMEWSCPSCVALDRSHQISRQLKQNWNDQQYRDNQLVKKQAVDYKKKQSEASIRRWQSIEYRSKLETGIDKTIYIDRSREQFGEQFDYQNTNFGNWQDRILVRCTKCGSQVSAHPQKHIEHGYCPKCGVSSGQREIISFLESYGEEVVIEDRSEIKPFELDVYLPKHKLAVEYHGIFWHSYDRPETPEEKQRHQDKALQCFKAGIKLFQIFDFEWKSQKSIIQSMLTNAVGRSIKFDARKLKLCELSHDRAQEFFQNNHVQGHRSAKTALALIDNNEIIIAASFNRYRDGFEIIRLATKCNALVRGGASRLIKSFRNLHQEKLYTFADLRFSSGNIYKRLGFQQISYTRPGYFYSKQHGSDYTILSRQQCQKHKQNRILGELFNNDLSESQNMFNAGFRRVWTAGNLLFVLQ